MTDQELTNLIDSIAEVNRKIEILKTFLIQSMHNDKLGSESLQIFKEENEKLKTENATLRHEFKMAQASTPEVKILRDKLQLACDSLELLKGVLERKMPLHPDWVQELLNELKR